MLKSLQDVIRAKSGQPGVDAITNYPFLVNATIDHRFYLKEEGKTRPAKTFTIHALDGTLIMGGVTGREPVGSGDAVIFEPGWTPTPQSFPGSELPEHLRNAVPSTPVPLYLPPQKSNTLLIAAVVSIVAIGALVMLRR